MKQIIMTRIPKDQLNNLKAINSVIDNYQPIPNCPIIYNGLPEVDFFNDLDGNPTISSQNSEYQISFYQTRETLLDVEIYRHFLKNAISRFRRSITYKHFKSFLMENGLNHCQYLGNINGDMKDEKTGKGVSIEMHHSIITIYDVACIICEHVLNTVGRITTFQLAELIRREHIQYHIPVCFLSLTPHQLYHNNDNFYISPSMVFGDWYTFLRRYWRGLNSPDIIRKIQYYLRRAIDEGNKSNDGQLLNLANQMYNWSLFGSTVNF